MAFVTAKSGGRFEIRESRRTANGPRSVTLATFRVLDQDVLSQAESRALSSFNHNQVRAAARSLGAPVQPNRADHLARALLAEMASGAEPAPGLQRVLRGAIGAGGATEADDLGDLAQWIGVPDDVRARALEDLLGLADAIPSRRRADTLSFPRLVSVA
jgi:hypothetical protein